jgi:ribosomal-protein-alanine N-acetyltransferase
MTPFTSFTLTSKRLTLRFLNEIDLLAIYEMHSNPEVMRYWSYPPWTDISQAHQMLLETQDGYLNGCALTLGIELNSDHRFLGTCSLFQFHFASRRAELGYALIRQYWGSGYMHEALQVLLSFAFQTLNQNRLEADIDPRNLASIKTIEKLGFLKEGHLRERWIVNDEISDT